MSELRWITLESRLRREDLVARLTDQTAGARRVSPLLGLSPMVLSVSESGFALRAFGVWKRYAVEGTIEPAEFGTRVILEVNPTERAPALQAVAAGLLALTLVSLLGIGMPYWTYFRAGDPLVWSSLATGLALLAALSIAAFDTPRMSNRALMALSRRLQAFLHAKAAS